MLLLIVIIIIGIIFFGSIAYYFIHSEKEIKKKKEAYYLAERQKEEQRRLYWEKYEADKKEKEQKEEIFLQEQIAKYDEIFGSENSIECHVEGIFARSKGARQEARALRKGDPVLLKGEPTNSYDDCAVKVISDRKHIGYIPREYSELVFKTITQKNSYKAIVKDQNTRFDLYYGKDETSLFIKIYLKNMNS